MKLGVVFCWHSLAAEQLLELVQRAEALGYAAAYHDGDVSQLSRRTEVDVLDGWTVSLWLLARTRRIGIGSIRLVQHWNPARLAQAVATAERLAPGRLQFFASVGERPEDPAWGYTPQPVGRRIDWLDESLDAVRALWRGESVTRQGRYVRLEGARVRPAPGPLPVEVAARRRRLLGLVARHAQRWNVNWPPIPARVEGSAALLAEACAEIGRDPATIERRLWMHTRVGRFETPQALAEFRRWNPWFAELSDEELAPSLIVGLAGRVPGAGLGALPPAPAGDAAGRSVRAGRRGRQGLPGGPPRGRISLTARISVT